MSTTREVISLRHLLDQLKPHAHFAQGIVLSTMPRGGLQVAQPLNISDAVLKAYTEGLHANDVLSWRALTEGRPIRFSDLAGDDRIGEYADRVLGLLGVRYAVALPLGSPVLAGYPGVVHLFRTVEQGNFTEDELASLAKAVRVFEIDLGQIRASHAPTGPVANALVRPAVRNVVLDAALHPRVGGETWAGLDDTLKSNVLEQVRRHGQPADGEQSAVHRLTIADSHGDLWVFNHVTFEAYPALGGGAVHFVCLQPECDDWNAVKSSDLHADQELARLIPAIRFMHAEYNRGPTLTEIAQQVKLSPFHFHRRFSELLGMKPKQYMLACQINKAKLDLLDGKKELATIAEECGFAHQSHFTSRFKQASGLTPTRWRRMALRRGVSNG